MFFETANGVRADDARVFLGLIEDPLRAPHFSKTRVTEVSEMIQESSGGEGGIRTHVPELPDHPISSRRRYDHFGTSPVNLKIVAFTYVLTALT